MEYINSLVALQVAEYHRIQREYRLQVWVKKLSPLANGRNPYAVLYFNQDPIGVPEFVSDYFYDLQTFSCYLHHSFVQMSYKLSKLIPELEPTVKYDVHDLFADNVKIDTLSTNQNLTLLVKTSGSVRMVKLVPAVG